MSKSGCSICCNVISLVPMIRPFKWQSLLLHVLPQRMLDVVDAPVPYIIDIEDLKFWYFPLPSKGQSVSIFLGYRAYGEVLDSTDHYVLHRILAEGSISNEGWFWRSCWLEEC